MAEALNSLFKAEWIRNPATRPTGGWKRVNDVEIAVAEYVDWFSHRRVHGELGLIPPAEFQANHWASTTEHYLTTGDMRPHDGLQSQVVPGPTGQPTVVWMPEF